MNKNNKNIIKQYFGNLIFPILLTSFFPIFLYNQNSDIINFSSAYRSLIISCIIAIIFFSITFIILRDGVKALNSSLILLVTIFTYRIFFKVLRRVELFTVDDKIFIPIYIFIGLLLSVLILKLNKKIARVLYDFARVLIIVLIISNIPQLISSTSQEIQTSTTQIYADETPNEYIFDGPDIYYIILDEYAGFDTISEYWDYDDIFKFSDFLEDEGFFVAQNSKSNTIKTLKEISSRLNLENLPQDKKNRYYYEKIINNLVFSKFENYGYSTVILDSTEISFKNREPINSDFRFYYKPEEEEFNIYGVTEFEQLVLDYTIFRYFSESYMITANPIYAERLGTLEYFLEKITQLDEIPSPKIIYMHLLMPHKPFFFDRQGNLNEEDAFLDWNNYLDYHIYATDQLKIITKQLLRKVDPNNPTIIILQSDHGPRNNVKDDPNHIALENFPEEYKYPILNALYLPGFDYSTLSDDISPTNTFIYIFNHYFGESIPLQ